MILISKRNSQRKMLQKMGPMKKMKNRAQSKKALFKNYQDHTSPKYSSNANPCSRPAALHQYFFYSNSINDTYSLFVDIKAKIELQGP